MRVSTVQDLIVWPPPVNRRPLHYANYPTGCSPCLPSGLLRLCRQYHLARHLAPGQRIERIRCLLERIRCPGVRLDLPCREPLPKFNGIGTMSRRIAFGEGTDPHADDAAAFDERQVKRNPGYVTGSFDARADRLQYPRDFGARDERQLGRSL